MHDSPGDRDPLALASRELVGEPVRHGGFEPDLLQHLAHTPTPVALDPEGPQRLPDDAPDAHPGVERSVGILEDDPRLAAQPMQ